ncbi:hypothetical protein Drorol1_Dr00016815 [Drosera rotundifolia]
MAAIAAAAAAATAALSALSLTRRTTLPLHPSLRSLRLRPRCSVASTPPSDTKSELRSLFFGEAKPGQSGPATIPCIVRGPDGNLTVSTQPPARVIQEAMLGTTQRKPKAKKKEGKTMEMGKAAAAGERRKVVVQSKAARRFYNENFAAPAQRLSKVLAAAGVASRRSSEELIFEGHVTVNNTVCKEPQTKVDPAKDVIYVKGKRLPKKLPPKVYLALNKPKGYICSSGEKESKSVLDLFEDYLKTWDKRHRGRPKPLLFTVGRLDVGTTGLIIVTNDGDFAQKISHPSSNLTKEYIATIQGDVHKRHLVTISEGTMIDGRHCTPDVVEFLPRQGDNPRHRIRVVVHEGRNHEVRELVKNAGLQMHSLKRIRIGSFRLPSDLRLGKHIELKQDDLKKLGCTS